MAYLLPQVRSPGPQVWVVVPIVTASSAALSRQIMGKDRNGSPLEDAAEWARKCRIEAVRAIHPSTKEFLLELAAKYEAIAGESVNLDPDDDEVQNAVADRLAILSAQRREWLK